MYTKRSLSQCLFASCLLYLSTTPPGYSQELSTLTTYSGDGEGQDNAYVDFRETIGQESSSVLTFIDYHQSLANWPGNAGWSSGYLKNSPALGNMVPIVSVGLADAPGGDTLAKMTAVAAGTHDVIFQNIVNVYKNKGYAKIYLRIGWEQNGSWHPWYATNTQVRADAFIAAWRRVADIAHATPGITVRTVWCPNIMQWSALSPNATYPGDAYVDVIAPDLYAKVWPGSGYVWPSGPALTPFDSSAAGVANQAIWATTHANAVINRQHFWDYPGATQWVQTGGWGLRSAIFLAMTHNKPFGISESGTGGNANGVNGPIDGGDFPLYLANRLWYKVQRGLKIEFLCIWNKDVSDGKWRFSDGYQPRNAASWVTFVNTMAGATPNIHQVENIATVSASDSITNITDGAATGNYVPPVAPTGGDPNSITEDTNLVSTAQIGGGAEILNANAVGDYVQYTIPVNRTGTYRVKVRLRKDSSRGQFRLSIAGGAAGPAQDSYSSVIPPGTVGHEAAVNYKYEILDLGPVTFTTTGSKTFRFTVSGKNASSSGYGLTLDYIHLSPTWPTVWQQQDVGPSSPAGNASYDGTVFSATNGAGGFHYIYQPANGDCTLTARVASLANSSDPWGKAGVSIRESLAVGAKQAMMIVSRGNGLRFEYKTTTGGTHVSTGASTGTAPYWVRVVRSGDTFTGYRSTDGVNWTQSASVTIAMNESVFIGLSLYGDSTATFGNVTAMP